MRVRSAEPRDAADWLRMRSELWPDGSRAEHAAEIAAFFAGAEELVVAVFVCEEAPQVVCGFLELSVRNYAEGCVGRTPHVEGWYVYPHSRRRGVGRALMQEAERWAVEHGYRELASDAESENRTSLLAHAALGFQEVERAVHYRKVLPAPPHDDADGSISMTIDVPADALIILVGPSGAGKSTFARRHFRETEIVSSDRCRALVSDDEADQEATRPAFEVFDALVRGRLGLGRLTVADATNLEAPTRERLREMARFHGRPVVAIVLNVPRDLAAAQNLARDRTVPSPVLDLHYDRFQAAREALAGEGYDAIYEVRPGGRVEIVRLEVDRLRGDSNAGPG